MGVWWMLWAVCVILWGTRGCIWGVHGGGDGGGLQEKSGLEIASKPRTNSTFLSSRLGTINCSNGILPNKADDSSGGIPSKTSPTIAKQEPAAVAEPTAQTTAAPNQAPIDRFTAQVLRISVPAAPRKESLAGGKTDLNSEEEELPSESVTTYEDLEEGTLDEEKGVEEEAVVGPLPPRVPYPEMDGVGVEPSPTKKTVVVVDPRIDQTHPNEKKSQLFIDSGIFPFIAMGVLSALFIVMMIAALYFARNSAGTPHGQIGMKPIEFGRSELAPSNGPVNVFNTVTFRAKDNDIGDFAINMFAVRQEAREEAARYSANLVETSLTDLPTAGVEAPPKIVPRNPTPLPQDVKVQQPTTLDSTKAILHGHLPDVVSSPLALSRNDNAMANRHSTGSSLYMELVNLSRNERLLRELALMKKTIRIQNAAQLDSDYTFPELVSSAEALASSTTRGYKLRRQASLDSWRWRDSAASVPMPCSYEAHYLKLYDADDDDEEEEEDGDGDDSSAVEISATTANTTMDTIIVSSDESNAVSGLHRKGSSKRNSRLLLDESPLLLPVHEFFNDAMFGGMEGDEALYETIDEMGYRRRTASSRHIRSLMAARESATSGSGQEGAEPETVLVENAWENYQKRYDRIDRRMRAFRRQTGKDKDYNTLVIEC